MAKKLLRYRKPAAAAAAVALIITALLFLNYRLKPIAAAEGRSSIRSIAADAMNAAVLDNFADVKYSDLYNVIKDANGRIVMLQANAACMNMLSSKTAMDAQRRIEQAGEQGVSIKLGTVIGGQLFSDMGPDFMVRFVPSGSVSAAFDSDFSAAGINQTLHRVRLVMTANVELLLSDIEEEVLVRIESPIGENIIVGEVPAAYGAPSAFSFVP